MSQNLSTDTKIRIVEAVTGAGTSAIESAVVDMQGYDGVIFITAIGTANAGNYIKAQQGTDGTVSDAADLEGTKVITTVGGECTGVDIFKPTERYLRLVVTRTASTVCGEIYAIQYSAAKKPVDNTVAGTTNIELHISPAEGTA